MHAPAPVSMLRAMELAELLDRFRQVAPEALAEAWDAVGLHVGWQRQPVQRVMLCIDLTEPVFHEATSEGVSLIVAYHPPIFQPVTALTDDEPRGRILLEAIRRGMAIYSPHTALDAAAGGVNDWLADALGEGERRPIRPVSAGVFADASESIPEPATHAGAGRVVELVEPIALRTLADRLKARLGMAQLHVGPPDAGDLDTRIRRIGLCPGAGGSLLEEAGPIDAFITGEMRHHDQLAAKARGLALLLPGHSETERPYLHAYRDRLAAVCEDEVSFHVSQRDAAPMQLG